MNEYEWNNEFHGIMNAWILVVDNNCGREGMFNKEAWTIYSKCVDFCMSQVQENFCVSLQKLHLHLLLVTADQVEDPDTLG